MARPPDDRQKDLSRPALEEIIDLSHPLVQMAQEIDWGFLDRRFSSVCTRGPGHPSLPTRLVAGLFILEHALAGEPLLPIFCGELSFRHKLPFDRSSLAH